MDTVNEILKRVKAAFLGEPVAPPVAPALAAPPMAPMAPTGTIYKTKGGVELSIMQAGTAPATGDTVTIAGVTAPAGDYELEDGSLLSIDATGMITVYTAAAPVTTTLTTLPANTIVLPNGTLTAGEVIRMFAQFAIGTTDERIANLEAMIKALMESQFGWQLREDREEAALQIYKDTIAGVQTTVTTYAQKLEAATQTISDQTKVTEKHEATIKGLFELVEKLVAEPTTDPVTLTGHQKEKFERFEKRDDRLKRMAEAMKKQKALA